jgi:hypothetical protein
MAEMKPHLALAVSDPDGTPWEVFTVIEDVEHAGASTGPAKAASACCA